MRKSYIYNNTEVIYDIEGEGEALVFLHGYLESRKIWGNFTGRFVKNYTVVKLDIPGHGESGVFADIHSMDELANVLKCILEQEKIDKATLIGHSMGGYMTMSFVALFPEMVTGFCLFHSTCFADSEEKRKNRIREIKFIRKGKKLLIVNTNIPNAFADDNVSGMINEVERAKDIAKESDDRGIISLLEGMKERKDYSGILTKWGNKALLIWGAKDNYISAEVFDRLVSLAPDSMQLTLNNSGHMGFIEEEGNSFEGVKSFLKTLK